MPNPRVIQMTKIQGDPQAAIKDQLQAEMIVQEAQSYYLSTWQYVAQSVNNVLNERIIAVFEWERK